MVIGLRRRATAVIALLLTLTVSSLAGAQATTPSTPQVTENWSYGGFADVSHLWAPNDPPNKLFRSRGTAWHLNDPHLNMTAAYVRKRASANSPWAAELTVQTGKDDEIFGFSATAPNIGGAKMLRHFGPTNLSYVAPVGNGLTVQGGIFGSLIGYDGLYAKDNLHYTRPWGADFTPYLMLGVNASYPLTEKLTGTLYVVNGYWHLANANSVPSTGVQLAYKATPQITVKESALWGPHQSSTALEFWRFISDTIVERKTERVTLAFNGHFATETVDDSGNTRAWWVAAQLPVRWNFRGPWSIAVRPEFAWDSTGRWTLAEQTVKAITTTLEYRAPFKWSNTLLRAEYRYDESRGPQGGFFAKDDLRPGENRLTPGQPLFMLAAIVTFDAPF